MAHDLSVLLDKPLLLLLILAVGAFCGITVERLVEGQRRSAKRAYWQGRNAAKRDGIVPFRKDKTTVPLKGTPERVSHDAAEQLRCVMDADFKARALLNKPERRLLSVIDKALLEEAPDWRTMGQVALGEILWSDDKDAFWAINAKRVDLLIVDGDCLPLHAIEFQGTGHHLSNETAARDAVKKEALRKAGIGLVEVVSGDTPAQVREIVRQLVRKSG